MWPSHSGYQYTRAEDDSLTYCLTMEMILLIDIRRKIDV